MPEDKETGFVSKLTVGRLGNPKKVGAMDGETATHHVCDIYGIIRGTKGKTLPNGDPSVALIGDFEGHGEEGTLSSGVLYMPSGIQEQMVAAFEGQGENPKPVKFALAIFTKKAKNPAGYEYLAKRLVKEEADDPLASIRAAMAEKKPALEKPKAEAETKPAKK